MTGCLPLESSPTERQLILCSAGTLARRRAEAARADRLIAHVDWPRLAETLRARRLLATLGPRVLELSDGRASDGFRAAVDEAIDAGRRHGALLQLISLRAIAMLGDAGIRSIALKGPLLGEAIYGDPGRRPSSDIDLLVSPGQLQAAVEVVRELGYGAPADYVYDCGLPLLHYVLVHERGELPPVELHWRVHWYERSFACERLLPHEGHSPEAWRPGRADELAALLLFYARDGFVGLRLASDLSAWWDANGGELAPGALDGLLRAYPALARVISAAVTVAEKVVGLPATQLIGDMPKRNLRGRMAARLANPHPRSSRAQIYADIGLIDGLLTPPGGFGAFVRRNVLPPPEVLNQQAEHGARRRPRSPLGRGAGMLGRYGLTATRLLRPSETLR
jgi:Uncharacterised nucleotidyltransferase